MSVFDDLVARYRGMSYGRLSGNNPSSVRSLLDEFNDRTYAQVLDPSQVTYLNGIPQNQWFYNDQGHLVFGMPGESVQGGLIGDGTTGWATYDQDVDYGDPGYAGVIPGEGGTGTGTTAQAQVQRGGGRDRGIGDSHISYEKINNSWYKINRKTGEVTKTDPRVPGLIGMAIDAMPNQNISNMLDRMESQYGLNVRDQVVRGLIDHDDFGPNPHTDVSLSSQQSMPAHLGLQAYNAQDDAGQASTSTTGGFDPSTQVGYDTDGDGIADRAVTDRYGNPVTWGEQDEAVGDPDPDGQQSPPSDRQPGLFGGGQQNGPSGVGPSGNPAQGGQPHGGW